MTEDPLDLGHVLGDCDHLPLVDASEQSSPCARSVPHLVLRAVVGNQTGHLPRVLPAALRAAAYGQSAAEIWSYLGDMARGLSRHPVAGKQLTFPARPTCTCGSVPILAIFSAVSLTPAANPAPTSTSCRPATFLVTMRAPSPRSSAAARRAPRRRLPKTA